MPLGILPKLQKFMFLSCLLKVRLFRKLAAKSYYCGTTVLFSVYLTFSHSLTPVNTHASRYFLNGTGLLSIAGAIYSIQ